jgi:uncharacterized protein (DUF1501 family)
MKRRKFLHTAGSAISLPILLNGMSISAMPKSSIFNAIDNDSDRVLVLIQLIGGNDGINTIVPLDQYDNLMNVRGNIMLPQSSLINVNDALAFHPNMAGIKNLYDDAKLGIVQGVAYPNQNRSHFRSTDIWTSGSPADEFWTTGWIGRHFDELYEGFPEGYPNETYPDPFAITMGNIVSETCQGIAANYSLTLNDPFSLSQLSEGEEGELPDNYYGEELSFLRTTIAQTNAYSETIIAAAEGGANVVDYPEDNRLAQQLKNVALLIAGGLGTKVYVVSLGGFDTHANQVVEGDVTTGEHAVLLATLSQAIATFQEDLKQLGLEERVVGMTFSEFGRRIRSNDSLGSDHGTAAPLLLFGSCVNPSILGDNPEIGTEVDIQEGVPMQYDFRDIYGSILMDWFEVSEDNVRSLLHQEFQHLPILQPCLTSVDSNPAPVEELKLTCFPNPFRDLVQIKFNCGNERVRLSIFDALGHEIKVIMDKQLAAGEHQITFDGRGLSPGSYFYRLQIGQQQKTRKIVKL